MMMERVQGRPEAPAEAKNLLSGRPEARLEAKNLLSGRPEARSEAKNLLSGRPEAHFQARNSYNFEKNFSIILSEATTKTSGRSATSKLQEN